MENIRVWTADLKKIIDQWEQDGIKALELYTSENEAGETNLIIDGLEAGGLVCIAADEEIHILTDDELYDIP